MDTRSPNSLTVCWALPKPTDQTQTKVTQTLHAVHGKDRPYVATPAHAHTHTHTHSCQFWEKSLYAHPEDLGVNATLSVQLWPW